MSKKFLVPIDLNQLELQNAALQNLGSAPASPVLGQVYFNTVQNKAMVWDGTDWIPWEISAGNVTGVKGNAETSYRTGNVNITPANIGVEAGAEVNQNAFSNVNAGGTTLSADSKTDTLNITAGSNVTVTGTASSDTVTISATDTTYDVVTAGTSTTTGGLMSEADKTKLDGIATGAEVNVQSDWNQTTTTADDYIKNKPSLGTASAKNVDTSITSGSTSTNLPTTQAVADFVASEIGAVDAMRFKGTIGTGGDVTSLPTSGVKVGDTYRVITAGTYAGQTCEIGDLIIATATTPTWTVAQTNIDGAITSITGTAPISVTGSGASRTVSISDATTSASGAMSSADKSKLNNITKAINNVITLTIPTTATSVTASAVTSGYLIGYSAWMNDEEVVVDADNNGNMGMIFSVASPPPSTIYIYAYVVFSV